MESDVTLMLTRINLDLRPLAGPKASGSLSMSLLAVAMFCWQWLHSVGSGYVPSGLRLVMYAPTRPEMEKLQ